MVGEDFENFKAWQIFYDDKIKVCGRRGQHKYLKLIVVRKTEKEETVWLENIYEYWHVRFDHSQYKM